MKQLLLWICVLSVLIALGFLALVFQLNTMNKQLTFIRENPIKIEIYINGRSAEEIPPTEPKTY